MTGTWLHARARGVPRLALGVAVVAALGWAAAQWLASRAFFDGPGARVPVVVLAPLVAAVLLGPTLGGADGQLERGMPIRWRWWRLAHLTVTTVTIAAALALIGLRAPENYGAYALVRNTVGLAGLVAGAAVVMGARLAWLPAFVYVCSIYPAGPARDGGPRLIWAWPVQSSAAAAPWWTAVALAVAGGAAYAVLGPKITGTPGA